MFRASLLYALLFVGAVQFLYTNQVVASGDDLLAGDLLSGRSSQTGQQQSISEQRHDPATPPHLRSLQGESGDSASRQYGNSGVPFTMSQVTSFAPSGTSGDGSTATPGGQPSCLSCPCMLAYSA